jgi:archaellum biogenesis ATPase FlaH
MSKQLPNALNEEYAVLGSILIDPDALARVAEIISAEDFYDERNKWIFEAMMTLHGQGTHLDLLTICDQMERMGTLSKVGGEGYVTELVNQVPVSLHAESYAQAIYRTAARHELMTASAKIAELAWRDGEAGPEEIIGQAQQLVDSVADRYRMAVTISSTWADLAEIIGPIQWNWPRWLPKGFLCEIVGEQETGKSILTLRIAACFLRGDPWPDGKPYDGETGTVVWAEAEASQAMNLERAKSWGLPIEKILHPSSDPLEDVQLNNSRHRAALVALAKRPDVRLIVVDSLSGGHQEEEKSATGMIPTIKWLAELARDTGKPIILTHHLRKRSLFDSSESVTLDRVRGSSGITQLARMVWAVDAPDPKKPECRRLSVIKSNLAPKPEPLGFEVKDGGLLFGEAPELPRPETQVDRAVELLEVLLRKGPMASTVIEEEAKGAAISQNTMRRAKEKLGIVVKKMNNRWYWALPATETA